LNIGGSEGVPMYLFDKINEAFTLERVYINDTRYTKADGAKWQLDEGGYTPLYNGEISLRIYNKQDEVTDLTGNVITLFEEPVSDPATAPYYIYVMGFVGTPILSAEYVDTTTYLTTLKDYLTNNVTGILGLRGGFDFTGGVWTYQNAYGENYLPIDFIVLTDPLIIDISTASPNRVMAVTIVNTALSSYGGIVWGDGSVANVNWQNFSVNSNSSSKITHTYANIDTYEIRVFCVDSLHQISLLRQDRTAIIENFRGSLPAGMNNFICLCTPDIEFSGLGSGLDLEFLAPARYNIRQFSITYAAFTEFDGDIFASYPAIGITGDSNAWKLLNGLSFYRCKLTASEVADFLIDFYDFTQKWTTGYIDLQQFPAAPLVDVTALAYKADLILNGWTVVTD